MESSRHNASLPYGDGIIAIGSYDLDPRPDALNLRRAYEDHLDGRPGKHALADRAVDLAAVSVPPNADVQSAQAGLLRVGNLFSEQNCAGTGAEGGLDVNEVLQLLDSAVPQDFEERS